MGIIIERGVHSLASLTFMKSGKIYMRRRMFSSDLMNFLLPF